MITEEILETSDFRGPPLPDGQRATIYLELTPILSRNNKPNTLGAVIPCISLLKRLQLNGYEPPLHLETAVPELFAEVRNGIVSRLIHEAKSAGKVIVQASADCKSILRACEQLSKQGHSLHVLYTDAHQFIGVPEHIDEHLSEQLAHGLMSAARLVPYTETFNIQLADHVTYPELRFHGSTQPTWRWSFGTEPVQLQSMPEWVRMFDQAATGNQERWLLSEVIPMISVID